MCIIIYAPKNKIVPMEHLRNSFDSNSHGAGVMYPEGSAVRIRKGFMTWEHFKEVLKEIPTDVSRVFHFRIATAGKVSKEVCHPYPVVKTYKEMYTTDTRCKIAAAHNGIISWCTPPKGVAESFSDSMAFITNYVYPHQDLLFSSESFRDLILHSTSSKFAFMSNTNTALVGNFIEEDGIYYSNTGYKYAFYSPKGVTHFRGTSRYPYYDLDDDTVDYYDSKKGYKKTEEDMVYHALKDCPTGKISKIPDTSDDTYNGCCIYFYRKDGTQMNAKEAYDLVDVLVEDFYIEYFEFEYDADTGCVLMEIDWSFLYNLPENIDGCSWTVI